MPFALACKYRVLANRSETILTHPDTPNADQPKLVTTALNSGVLDVGLTGGIGSGKSAAATIFAEKGAGIIDADKTTRSVQKSGSVVFDLVLKHFGTEILGPDKELNRAALAELVFNDPGQLEALNAIVHPHVFAEMAKERAELIKDHDIIIHSVPLLIENLDEEMNHIDLIISIETETEIAIERLIRTRGYSRQQALARIDKQLSVEQRRQHSDYIITNNAGFGELEEQVEQCWKWLKAHKIQ